MAQRFALKPFRITQLSRHHSRFLNKLVELFLFLLTSENSRFMVHIKAVELSHFKSFGGTTKVPLLPGFTVISGPNGSGKSNILDALLFCLGLSTSKGMRAERLPDLVNHNCNKNGRSAETIVSVTFDLSDLGDLAVQVIQDATKNITEDTTEEIIENNGEEIIQNTNQNNNQTLDWTVTRRLRVSKGGSYASYYYINGKPCTANELHQQLNRLRIYPEGYNVVLQGDVTRIITMNSKERREIIDELAGVAEFDRKIEQTKKTLDEVKEREERCRIIEQELIKARDRLDADRVKAQKYKQLREKIQEKKQWEIVLIWRSLLQQKQQIEQEIEGGKTQLTNFTEQLKTLENQINLATTEYEKLNSRVKELGEEEQLSVASKLATQKAKRHQLQQQKQELEKTVTNNQIAIKKTEEEIKLEKQNIEQIKVSQSQLIETIPTLEKQQQQSQSLLEESKEKANAIAQQSEAWVKQQTTLTHKISNIQKTLNPQQTQQAQLTERYSQLQNKIQEQTQQYQNIETEIINKQNELGNLSNQFTNSTEIIQTLAQNLANAETQKNLELETQNRLLKEQREKQRLLDKLEATSKAQQEVQGTYATKFILQSDLPGICGLVAQLGNVAPEYQLALEIAAGSRLGNIVVEDDAVAAAGIKLLKEKRIGRATFLPLNKIRASRASSPGMLRYATGYMDLAVNLIDCESRYRIVFQYVFGNTIVFENIDNARAYLGQNRIVTLTGDLLETSGAMTGGSQPNRSSIHFGNVSAKESEELNNLRKRLIEIEEILTRCEAKIQEKTVKIRELSHGLTEARQEGTKQQLKVEQLQGEIKRLTQQKEDFNIQIDRNTIELNEANNTLKILTEQIPILEAELKENQDSLAQLEASQTHSEWQTIQSSIKTQEKELKDLELALRKAEEELKDLGNNCLRKEEKIEENQGKLQEYREQEEEFTNQQLEVSNLLVEIEEKITETEEILKQLAGKLEEVKKERDEAEKSLRELQDKHQKKTWQLQKLETTQEERQASIESLEEKIKEQEQELPDPIPEIPQLIATSNGEEEIQEITFNTFSAQLEQLQKDIRKAQKRLEAMEPVNMLALEEYEENQARLEELSQKLETLKAERTELLLRIENFTTLRFRAFKEAFDAVNENFQTIFASLSDGDGYLKLDDEEDPFKGGLNLVAHPKGKPVQRLSSMSGGEKSLTALSFIFALQRYRPSPFYAFDEVDMFLDGANVEKLAKMIRTQAELAQFIVVSLRRPMIESSQRTIGVTQARGAYTQVLGIKL